MSAAWRRRTIDTHAHTCTCGRTHTHTHTHTHTCTPTPKCELTHCYTNTIDSLSNTPMSMHECACHTKTLTHNITLTHIRIYCWRWAQGLDYERVPSSHGRKHAPVRKSHGGSLRCQSTQGLLGAVVCAEASSLYGLFQQSFRTCCLPLAMEKVQPHH